MRTVLKYGTAAAVGVAASLAAGLVVTMDIAAADHGDAPIAAVNLGADIADLFLFLNPNDNSRVVIAGVFGSALAPAEGPDFGFFDEGVRYRFELETTGDVNPDSAISVRFFPPAPTAGGGGAQTAVVKLPGGSTFTALTTPASLDAAPPLPVITRDPASDVEFFAGVADDPFFFDIPAELFYRRARLACVAANPSSPDPVCMKAARQRLRRGRDSLAGYNALVLALDVPLALLVPPGQGLGVNLLSLMQSTTVVNKQVQRTGNFFTVDRLGVPTFTEFFIPLERRNEYNFSTPDEDAAGLFRNDIVAGLRALGTNAASTGALLDLGVVRGDYLRLNPAIPNFGPGGGDNPQGGFPNGRRPSDDVIDTIITLVNNGQRLADSVFANDVANKDTFPFFADPHQPAPAGTIDDGTRN